MCHYKSLLTSSCTNQNWNDENNNFKLKKLSPNKIFQNVYSSFSISIVSDDLMWCHHVFGGLSRTISRDREMFIRGVHGFFKVTFLTCFLLIFVPFIQCDWCYGMWFYLFFQNFNTTGRYGNQNDEYSIIYKHWWKHLWLHIFFITLLPD